MTYNYQLDTLEGCFGRQPCRCGARNCSGFIGKRPQGSGLGPREAWRAAARKLLEMRMPPLAALRGLLAEARAVGVGVGGGDSKPGLEEAAMATAAADADAGADGTDGAKGGGEEEYAALLGKAEAAGAWLARYRQLMGGWREEEQQGGEEEEVKPEVGAGGQDVGGLVEMEALAALVAAAPKDVKLPEATQARNTLTRARQARTALRLLYETALKNWTPPAPSPPPILLPTAASADEHGQQPQPPPASAMDMDVAGAEAPEPPPAAAAVAEAADAAAPAPADAAAVDASSAPAPPAPTDAAVSAAAAAAAAAAAGASSDTPSATAGIGPPEAEGAAAPPPQWEFVAGGATMKEVVALLRDALACAPVRVPGLGAAVAMLMEVDAWAARACQRLGVKVKEKEGGKGEGDGKAEAGPEDEEGGGRRAKKERQRKAADADPGVLLRRLARLYAGEEGLAPERVAGAFRGLDALEEALADMVEMVRACACLILGVSGGGFVLCRPCRSLYVRMHLPAGHLPRGEQGARAGPPAAGGGEAGDQGGGSGLDPGCRGRGPLRLARLHRHDGHRRHLRRERDRERRRHRGGRRRHRRGGQRGDRGRGGRWRRPAREPAGGGAQEGGAGGGSCGGGGDGGGQWEWERGEKEGGQDGGGAPAGAAALLLPAARARYDFCVL